VPNQRSKNKTYLGGFVEKELHAEIVRLAKQDGMQNNKFGFVAKLIEQSISRRKKKKASRAKA
jgi:hypothetical protein